MLNGIHPRCARKTTTLIIQHNAVQKKAAYIHLWAVIGEQGSASLGINSNPRPSLIIVEARSIIAAVSGRVALYSLSLTGA